MVNVTGVIEEFVDELYYDETDMISNYVHEIITDNIKEPIMILTASEIYCEVFRFPAGKFSIV